MADSNSDELHDYAKLIEDLLRQLSRLPAPLRRKMEAELQELLHLVRDRRPPRFMLVGRRGAGKSTLINAIFGKPVQQVGPVKAQTGASLWREYEVDGRKLEILDTRGLQEGDAPVEQDQASSSEESILNSIREHCPDAVLFLCKAKEVDAAIHSDLDSMERILQTIETSHNRRLPIVGVLTQCDELDPPDMRKLPTDDEEKNSHIKAATDLLQNRITSRKYLDQTFVRVVPTVAYARFRQDGTLDEARDYRWNIDALVGVLVDELPKEAKLNFARLAKVRRFQRIIAQRIVDICSLGCGAIGAEPIPVADMPILTTIQGLMIVAIAYVGGRELSLNMAREFMVSVGVNVGAAFVLREAVRGLLKVIPGYGNLVSGSVAALATRAIGSAAIAYFIDNKNIEAVKAAMR